MFESDWNKGKEQSHERCGKQRHKSESVGGRKATTL